MRWFAHVLARLVIAATCTSSAAALVAHNELEKYPSFSTSLWEHLMSNSFKSVNKAVRLNSVPSAELRFDTRDSRGTAQARLRRVPRSDGAEANSHPAALPTTTREDAPWSPVVAFFMEGFALYGASYCASLGPIATRPIEARPTEAHAGQPKRLSVRERRGSIAIAYSSIGREPAGAELENEANQAGPESDVPSEDAGIARFYIWPSSTDGSNRRNWLTRPLATIASRWAHWRREREIKRTVAALVELDDRTLRDAGIPCRSEIEQAVRYGRDC
jgi:uncharacterized protein YjiS (DUF1127 family)